MKRAEGTGDGCQEGGMFGVGLVMEAGSRFIYRSEWGWVNDELVGSV